VQRLSIELVLLLHKRIIRQSGGKPGLRDCKGLQSALAQPRMTFEGKDLYPTTVEKACALGFSLINNHPFMDGNKRIGHAVMELFLYLHGYEICAPVDEQERVILQVAAGNFSREELMTWLKNHIIPIPVR
jgi:death-on-curing protein